MTLLIGHDDETWDVAITVPLTVVDGIVGEAPAAYALSVSVNARARD